MYVVNLEARIVAPGQAGRVIALLAATAFVLAGLTGNSFSSHAGMTTMSAPPATTAAASGDGLPAQGDASADPSQQGPSEVAGPASPVPINPDGQHLMHLLGACLAILAAAGLLLRRLLGEVHMGGGPTMLRPAAASSSTAWLGPAPSPPRTSPVIRS